MNTTTLTHSVDAEDIGNGLIIVEASEEIGTGLIIVEANDAADVGTGLIIVEASDIQNRIAPEQTTIAGIPGLPEALN